MPEGLTVVHPSRECATPKEVVTSGIPIIRCRLRLPLSKVPRAQTRTKSQLLTPAFGATMQPEELRRARGAHYLLLFFEMHEAVRQKP